MSTHIALLLTTDEDGDDALRHANELAEGIAQDGENISVLGDASGEWIMGGTREDADTLVEALAAYADGAEGPGVDRALVLLGSISAQLHPDEDGE